MSKLSIGRDGRRIRGEVAVGVLLVAAGIIGVTMLRAPQEPVAETGSSSSTTIAVIGEGRALVAVALPAGSFPPVLSPGDAVQLFGSTLSLDGVRASVVRAPEPAVVHDVTSDPMGDDTVVTVLGAASLAEFLVLADDVRLVIVTGAP